jgi:hypothetical protein
VLRTHVELSTLAHNSIIARVELLTKAKEKHILRGSDYVPFINNCPGTVCSVAACSRCWEGETSSDASKPQSRSCSGYKLALLGAIRNGSLYSVLSGFRISRTDGESGSQLLPPIKFGMSPGEERQGAVDFWKFSSR